HTPKEPSKQQRIRPTVEEVLDTYYVPDEPKKKSPQDVALGLGIDLKPLQTLLSKCNDILQR
ncbi:23956_t:CDS:1, partial [Gigaspora rosea]